eukprot:1642643-Alexandrium_andersonii.AAC.1
MLLMPVPSQARPRLVALRAPPRRPPLVPLPARPASNARPPVLLPPVPPQTRRLPRAVRAAPLRPCLAPPAVR